MSTAKYERSGYSFAIFYWLVTPFPTNVGRTEYDELLNFQIVLTLYRHQRLSRCFQRAVAFVPEFPVLPEAGHDAIGRFHFHFTGRDEIVRQQRLDFTGRGRIAGITFHGTFFIVANVKFVSLTSHAFYAFRHFHGGFSLRTALTKPLRVTTFGGFDRDIQLLLILSGLPAQLYFRSDGAVIP